MDSQTSPSDPHIPNNDGAAHSQKRKRLPRALLACESCRSRKLRCDQLTPCTNCAKRSLACEYRSLEVPLPSAATHPNGQPVGPTSAIGASYDDSVKRRASSGASFVGAQAFQSRFPSGPSSTNYATIAPRRNDGFGATSVPKQPPGDADLGFEEVNRHTHGTEYYGPVSLFSFLKKLRSRAQSQKSRSTMIERPEARNTRDARDMSIVNLLHSSDYPMTSPASGNAASPEHARQPSLGSNHNTPNVMPSPSSMQLGFDRMSSTPFVIPFTRMSNQDIERECIRLYFANLHNVHPILDQVKFMERCEAEVWTKNEVEETQCHHAFLALFYAIAAVGAIQAGEDAAFMRDTASARQAERYAGGNADGKAPAYPPLMLAKLFFERAKANLPDVFESCSLDTVQTLFFMAVFCQNALKPHSCYLYMGMAVRGSLAIGLPNYSGPDLVRASTTWWGLYSLEIEMCATAGRESSLRDPRQYRIPLPHMAAPDDPKQMFQTKMIDLAHIVAELAAVTEDAEFGEKLGEKSAQCLTIDAKLCEWKKSLPANLDWESSSLVEPEWVSKQKVVLRNRFLNTRLLIHRPFLIAASSATSPTNTYTTHVTTCVDASVLTIESLHEIYRHRPYFRTWWYNTTYTLYASMVLLYVILSNMDVENTTNALDGAKGYSRDYLLKVVQQSVELFQAMDMVAVARRCVEVTQEILEIAKKNRASSQPPGNPAIAQMPGTATASGESTAAPTPTPGFNAALWDNSSFPGFDADGGLDFLIDSNLMEGLAPFSNMNGLEGNLDFMDFNSVLGAGPFV